MTTAYVDRHGDGSLEQRILAYTSAVDAHRVIQEYQQVLDQQDAYEWFGDPVDFSDAEIILKNTMSRVAADLKKADIEFAVDSSLISREQASDIAKLKLTSEFSQLRKLPKNSQSSGQKQS